MNSFAEETHRGAIRSAVWLGRFLGALLLLSLTRLTWVQLYPADPVFARVMSQSGRPVWRNGTTLVEQGRRGRILARDGRPLALGYHVHDLVIDPVDFRKLTRDRAYKAQVLLRQLLTDVDPRHAGDDLEDALFREFVTTEDGRRLTIRHRTLLRGLGPRDTERVREGLKRAKVPGASLIPRLRRQYPEGALVSQVIGLAGEVESDKTGAIRGRMGIELSMETFLSGQTGAFAAERDAKGTEMIREVAWTDAPLDGADVRLSLDVDVQRIASRALAEGCEHNEARVGSAIVLDVHNGDVLACTSWPSADRDDPNADFKYLSLAAVQGRYSPGSTMKPLIVGWALKTGAITADETFDCGGVIGSKRIGGHNVREYSVNPEPLTAERILIRSSNVGAVTIGFERLGLSGMYDALEAVNLKGRPLSGFPGVVPGTYTSRSHAKPRFTGPMFPQGYEMAASPMALARIYLALARGGVLLEPRLLLGIEGADGVHNEPVNEGARILPAYVCQFLTHAMVNVVDDDGGTGKKARSSRYTLAGKSGTGQVTTPAEMKSGLYNAWFCTFAPAWDPRVVVVVHQQVKNRGPGTYTGGSVSGPVAKKIVEETLDSLNVLPDRDGQGDGVPR